jgi:hypothetical protein
MSAIDNIISDATSEYDQLVVVKQALTDYSNEITSLESEDPCSPGFLDKLNTLDETASTLTDQKRNLSTQFKATIADYENLGILDFGDKVAAKSAIDKVTAIVNEVIAVSDSINGLARKQAMRTANAKCGLGTASDATTPQTAENSSNEDSNAGDATATSGDATGVSPPSSSINIDGQKSGNSSSDAPSLSSTKYPGQRKVNPLSKLCSYVYSFSLYMVTPEALNNFINNGGSLSGIKGKNSGVYIVAQSGGVNTSTEDRLLTTSHNLGSGEPGFDYYIDDLILTTLLPGGANRATTSTEIKFKIIEPQSYNFLQDIARGSAALNEKSKLLQDAIKNGVAPNGFSQHYILGIKFYGYDVNGNIITAGSPEAAGYDNGDNGDQNAIIQRFFAIKFTNIKFKLDGKMTTYNCEALVVSEQAAYGQINATIKNTFSITGGTVGEALAGGIGGNSSKDARGLQQVVNDFVKDQKDRELISAANEIKIEFLDENGAPTTNSPIAKSSLLDDASWTASTAPLSKTKTTDGVTIADSFKAVSIDKTKKSIPIVAGQNIIHIIDNIIVKSAYIGNALKETVSADEEAETVKKASTATLKWYTINPIINVLARDAKTNNWSYNITYQIKPYDIPYIRTNLATVKSKYPGPFKFYEYLLTGKNTEVMSYEQQYDNLFYTVASMSTNKDSSTTGNKSNAPTGIQAASKNSDPTTGAQNSGSRLNDDVRAQLYSPGDQGQAKIKILGDPDYIMTTTGVKTTTASKFYGKDSSINPQGGQVFIQMVFNTASDYGNDGLLDVSDKLQFYKTDSVKKAGIDGMVYMVVQVDSTFSRGTFSQVLDCLMVDESMLVTKDIVSAVDSTRASSTVSSSKTNTTGTSKTTTVISNQASAVGASGSNAVKTDVSAGVREDSQDAANTAEVQQQFAANESTNSSNTDTAPLTDEQINNMMTSGVDKPYVNDDAITGGDTQLSQIYQDDYWT